MAIKPILFNTEMVRAILDGRKTCTRRIVKFTPSFFEVNEKPVYLYDTEPSMGKIYPPCQPGDILYVRETWDCYPEYEDENAPAIYYYKADGDLRPEGYREICKGWLPSIHMPKKAARIWLKVTDVRVERLQGMTQEDAEKEGAAEKIDLKTKFRESALLNFLRIWDSTIKKSNIDRYGWNANPWVWVIEFERCEKPKEVEE